MSKINVACSVREYPDDDKPYRTITIRNHWNGEDRVVFELEDQAEYVFIASDLVKAIQNALNAH